MGGAANPILGSLLNGIGTNILAGNDPVKGALINASALAGSGNMPSVIPGMQGGASSVFSGQSIPPITPPTQAIPGMQGGVSSVFSSPTVMSPPPIQGLVGGSSSVFSNPYTSPTVSQTFPLSSASNVPAPIVEMGTNAASPSYWDQFKIFNRENPGLTQMGFSTAKDVLTPEQIAQAPAVPVQARGQLRPYDPIAMMNPYQQSVIGGQPISLI